MNNLYQIYFAFLNESSIAVARYAHLAFFVKEKCQSCMGK